MNNVNKWIREKLIDKSSFFGELGKSQLQFTIQYLLPKIFPPLISKA